MPETTLAADMSQCLIFQDLTSEERAEVLALVEQEQFPPGETILREGRSIQMLWVLIEGQCEVVKSKRTGGEQILALLDPWSVFGEMSFYNPAPHSASVRTLCNVTVLTLSRENYDQLCQTTPAAAHKIACNTNQILSERIRKMDDWVCELVERPGAQQHRKEWREFRAKLYTDWQF